MSILHLLRQMSSAKVNFRKWRRLLIKGLNHGSVYREPCERPLLFLHMFTLFPVHIFCNLPWGSNVTGTTSEILLLKSHTYGPWGLTQDQQVSVLSRNVTDGIFQTERPNPRFGSAPPGRRESCLPAVPFCWSIAAYKATSNYKNCAPSTSQSQMTTKTCTTSESVSSEEKL